MFLRRGERDTGTPAGLMIVGGFSVIVLASMAAALLFPASDPWPRVMIMAVAVCGYGAGTAHIVSALTTAGFAWLFTTGFLINTAGELALTGVADLQRLAVLALAALAGLGLGVVPRTRTLAERGGRSRGMVA
jgi:hypothetical protein